jgi:membrane protease YdiL (CAAX protease family)
MSLLPFFFLALAMVSVWIKRNQKIWCGFLILSLLAGIVFGNVTWIGLLIVAGWAALWLTYEKERSWLLFALIVLASYGFKFHMFPGFNATPITPRFWLGLEAPLVGFFPLALLVPIALRAKEWKEVAIKGIWPAVLGIAILAGLAILVGAVHPSFQLPSAAWIRFPANLLLTAIPEEAFYRGFVQRELGKVVPKWVALIAASLIFTLAHLYWAPNLSILAFVFLAGLLYGYVYNLTGKLESAILCHFLLNAIHMTFFTYHPM